VWPDLVLVQSQSGKIGGERAGDPNDQSRLGITLITGASTGIGAIQHRMPALVVR